MSPRSRASRRGGAGGARRPSHRRQLRNPQDGADSPLVGQAPAISCALHSDGRLVAQPRRALVRAADGEAVKRGVHPTVRALKLAIMHYLGLTNEHPKPFGWTKTADEILASVARFWRRI